MISRSGCHPWELEADRSWPYPVPMPTASPNQARILASLLSDDSFWDRSSLRRHSGVKNIYQCIAALYGKGCVYQAPSLDHFQITDSGVRTLARFNGVL